MNVISMKKPQFSAYFFTESGVDVVRRWFEACVNAEAEWSAFQGQLDIFKAGGYHAIKSTTVELGNGLYGFKVQRSGGAIPCPIFTIGPFDKETEITFLIGARWDEVKKRVRPYGSEGTAEENLETLVGDSKRRRRG